MRFAVEEINNNRSLLPNVTLGYEIFDYCSDMLNFPAVFDFLANNGSVLVKTGLNSQYKVISVTGPFGSTPTITIAPLLMSKLIPMVTYGASSIQLSDKARFPSFLRTIPSDKHQVQLIIQILQTFKWNWVAYIGGDNDYSNDAFQFFVDRIGLTDICLAYQAIVPRQSSNIGEVLNKIATLNVSVVVIFALPEVAVPVIQMAINTKVRNKVWIASEAWSLNQQLLGITGIETIGTIIGVTLNGLWTLPGFDAFVQKTMARGETWSCSNGQQMSAVETCNQFCLQCSNESSKDITSEDPTFSFPIYSSVYAVAHALHQALECNTTSCQRAGTVYPYMVFEKLKRMRFTLQGRIIEFDASGDPPPQYDIIAPVLVCSSECKDGFRKKQRGIHKCCFDCELCPNGTFVNYTADPETCKGCGKDEWADEGSTSCTMRSIEYLHYREQISVGIMLCSSLVFFLSVAITILFARNCNTPVVKSAGGKMCFFMLSCLTVACISVFFYVGEPLMPNCMLSNPVFAVFYTACLACLAVRSFQIVFIFKMAAKLPRAYDFWVKHNGQWLVIVTSVVIQILLCGIWIGTGGPKPFNNTSAYKDRTIVICDMGNLYAFLTVIAFVGCLSVACFIFSYMGTDLPKNYNEAKSITFSLLIFFLAWISYFTAQIVYKGKYIQAINAVSVLASLYGILFGYFIPKCYIIIFTPEKNTPAHFQTCIQSYTKTISSM
ncbi:taste receptor type 1 member 1-like [Amia ocellicauda]|uniref:taste receptor type 1 member 1-like n=1 Tax=Amia ocellicauda TaxID=2972642 RepID=UPI003463E314